ncbi:MAG: Rieske 2Fe-2S domain-containing protein, partial [Chloroflexota bacterium]|nr:Rieske 2Fe-2S domain-containing protein [Chloroflexota bacterium]
MLSAQDNEMITRTGSGTPMGEYLRRFWMPVLLSEEIAEPDSPPVRVKILNEELVAYRDTNGDVGLLDNYCPHRRASLFFGRNEE